jgi:hypothetical protein
VKAHFMIAQSAQVYRAPADEDAYCLVKVSGNIQGLQMIMVLASDPDPVTTNRQQSPGRAAMDVGVGSCKN